jgi:hypothetical protein
LHGAPGGSDDVHGGRRASAYGDAAHERPIRVAVAAGSPRRLERTPAGPEAGLSLDLDWQAALVALATAVVERGGTLVVPANVEVTYMLALAAYPHARPHAAERARELAPVQAVETGGHSPPSRHLLSPLVRRNGLTYHDQEGRVVPPSELPGTGEEDGDLLASAGHHPLAGPMLDGVDGVVVVHPDREMVAELLELRFSGPVAVFGGRGIHPELDEWAARHDPIPRLPEEVAGRMDFADAMPYGLVMELLVDEWQPPLLR